MHGNSREAALAYIAGIIDGEGTVRINRCSGAKTMKSTGRKNPVHSASVSVGMTCPKVPQFLKDITGYGSIRLERVPQENRRDIYRYAITSRHQVCDFLKQIFPYLITKKPQAELLIEFCHRPLNAAWKNSGIPPEELHWREEMHQQMLKLNANGAPATTERSGTRESEATV